MEKHKEVKPKDVAPCVGAWVETCSVLSRIAPTGRPLRGGVG